MVDHGKATMVQIDKGVERKTEMQISPFTFLSTSFSELLNANDFSKHPAVQFQTVTPGNSPNLFIAEVFADRTFLIASGKTIDTWIIKFTRVDEKGQKTSAGFRHVDKSTGKVLMFKSDLNGPKFFTYQILTLP